MNRKRLFAGLLLACIFLFLFLRNLDPTQIWSAIQKANPYWLVACVSVNMLNYFLRAIRWNYFLKPIKNTHLWNRFTTTVIGFAVNTIFPAKLGEIVRPYLLGIKENISKSSALATIVVERIVDTLSILFVLVIYLVFLIQPQHLSPQARGSLQALNRGGLAVFAGVLVLVLFLYYLKTKPTLILKAIRKIEKRLPAKIVHSLDEMLDSFIHGLSILHDPKVLGTISVYSIFFWMVICFGFWCGVRAYLPGFPFTGTFLIILLLAIGIALPTPGGVGSYHLACQIGLTHFFNVPEMEAGAIAVVTHFLAFVPVTLLGIFFLWKEGLNASKLQAIAADSKDNS